jgi:hypothetical protein
LAGQLDLENISEISNFQSSIEATRNGYCHGANHGARKGCLDWRGNLTWKKSGEFFASFSLGKLGIFYAWPHPILKTADFLVSQRKIKRFFGLLIHVERVMKAKYREGNERAQSYSGFGSNVLLLWGNFGCSVLT